METLILQTENNAPTKEILKLISKKKFVKFIAIENNDKRVAMEDMALAGRPLTDIELDQMSELMDKETEFKKSNAVFESIIKSIKK